MTHKEKRQAKKEFKKQRILLRRQMKSAAKTNLFQHYLVLILLCLATLLLGNGFSGTISSIQSLGTNSSASSAKSDKDNNKSEATIGNVINAILQGDTSEAVKISQKINDDKIKNSQNSEILQRTNGVFARIANNFSSGNIIVKVASTLNNAIGSSSVTAAILIILAFAALFLFWFYIQNAVTIIICRFFLEGRTYKKLDVQRILYLKSTKSWTKAAWTMLVRFIYQCLWSITIVGGFIKLFSYALVPYIVAENPTVKPNEAITLSRKMMKGHKWQLCKSYCTFLGWFLLDSIMFGLLGYLFVTPYIHGFTAEFFSQMRKEAFEKNIDGIEILNDNYLYEKADQTTLYEAYSDIAELMEQPEADCQKNGFAGFIANIFGVVWSRNSPEEIAYEDGIERHEQIRLFKTMLDAESYPVRLSPIHLKDAKVSKRTTGALRHYPISTVILMFFIFSFVGWLWEVAFHLVEDGVFVNRGVMHGPWLPIYGAGGVMILVLLNKFRSHPVGEFFAAIILCGFVEYMTAFILETTHNGMKWWDYSGYFLNLHGRICAEGLLVFGVGGIAMVYIFGPMMDNALKKFSEKNLAIICCILMVCFIGDGIYSHKIPNSGDGISTNAVSILTDLNCAFYDSNTLF